MLAAALLGGCSAPSSRPPDLPPLHVMTALPLFLAEGSVADILHKASPPPPVIAYLRRERQVLPLDIARPETLSGVKALLLIQPPALAPDELVAIDAWIRSGGRAVILADPHLFWPSSLPKGDPRRAPHASLLSPLLAHWGLRLRPDAPDAPPRPISFGNGDAVLSGSGRWQIMAPGCRLIRPELARCQLGSGEVLVLSDADWLNTPSADSAAFELLRALIAAVNPQSAPKQAPPSRVNLSLKDKDSP